MPEQKPTQPMSSEAQPAASIEERIKVAGPIEVEGAFQSFFDLVDQHSSSLETAGKMGTLTTEQINAKNQELHADMDAFRVAYGMFEEWSTAPEESRGAFPSFIKDKVMHARATGDKDATKGADWGSKYYNNSLKSYFESQDASASQAEQEQPAPEHQVFREPTQAERQAQAVSNEEARQQLEAQRAAENARKVVVVDEARRSMESVREQGELIQAVVSAGKGKTHVNANHKQGQTNLGDMLIDEVKKVVSSKGEVGAFGPVDINGNLEVPGYGKDWRGTGNAERVMFKPVVEQEFRTESKKVLIQQKQGFFGKDVYKDTNVQVPVAGSEHQKLVVNPETGQSEPAVIFSYDFDQNALGSAGANEMGYSEFIGGRLSTGFRVAVELPKSVADKLLANIEKRPAYVREVVEALVLHNTGGKISAEDWNQGDPVGKTPMKPPYARAQELDPDWKIAVAKPKPDADITTFIRGRKAEGFETSRYQVY